MSIMLIADINSIFSYTLFIFYHRYLLISTVTDSNELLSLIFKLFIILLRVWSNYAWKFGVMYQLKFEKWYFKLKYNKLFFKEVAISIKNYFT